MQLSTYDTGYEEGAHDGYQQGLRDGRAEIEAMRPVVEAVGEWMTARPLRLTAPRLDAAYAAYRQRQEGDDTDKPEGAMVDSCRCGETWTDGGCCPTCSDDMDTDKPETCPAVRHAHAEERAGADWCQDHAWYTGVDSTPCPYCERDECRAGLADCAAAWRELGGVLGYGAQPEAPRVVARQMIEDVRRMMNGKQAVIPVDQVYIGPYTTPDGQDVYGPCLPPETLATGLTVAEVQRDALRMLKRKLYAELGVLRRSAEMDHAEMREQDATIEAMRPVAETCLECGGSRRFSPTPVRSDGWPCSACSHPAPDTDKLVCPTCDDTGYPAFNAERTEYGGDPCNCPAGAPPEVETCPAVRHAHAEELAEASADIIRVLQREDALRVRLTKAEAELAAMRPLLAALIAEHGAALCLDGPDLKEEDWGAHDVLWGEADGALYAYRKHKEVRDAE